MPSPIQTGFLVSRPNRFLGIVRTAKGLEQAFIPNPGRMNELLYPGKKVFLRAVPKAAERKTKYDLIGVEYANVLVSIDSNLPNRFMKNLLLAQQFAPFRGFDLVRAEPSAFDGRFDFEVSDGTNSAFLEVKSCTLVESGQALFPDAPTSRGARHMNNLARSLTEGLVDRAAVVFVIQRPDAVDFSPNDKMDPRFGAALREAHAQGVEAYALTCDVKDWQLSLREFVPVVL